MCTPLNRITQCTFSSCYLLIDVFLYDLGLDCSNEALVQQPGLVCSAFYHWHRDVRLLTQPWWQFHSTQCPLWIVLSCWLESLCVCEDSRVKVDDWFCIILLHTINTFLYVQRQKPFKPFNFQDLSRVFFYFRRHISKSKRSLMARWQRINIG